MKSEESTFTQFNFSFITFPRQVFVNIIDDKREEKTSGGDVQNYNRRYYSFLSERCRMLNSHPQYCWL